MPRTLSTAMLTALSGAAVSLAVFVEAEFASGVVRVWSGSGDRSWNGHTWQGLGSLAGISPIEDGDRVEARGIVLTLSGFDAVALSSVLDEFRLGKPVTVYLGVFNGTSIVADPVTAWAGRIDQPSIDVGPEASIAINCESRLLDMNVAVDRRWTSDDQQREHPGDLGFSFVTRIQEMTLWFGQSPSKT